MSHARRLRRLRAHERFLAATGHWGPAACRAQSHAWDDWGYMHSGAGRRRMPDPNWCWQRRAWWIYPARSRADAEAARLPEQERLVRWNAVIAAQRPVTDADFDPAQRAHLAEHHPEIADSL